MTLMKDTDLRRLKEGTSMLAIVCFGRYWMSLLTQHAILQKAGIEELLNGFDWNFKFFDSEEFEKFDS